jgi:hypothetical protein
MKKAEEIFSKANAVVEEFARHSFTDKENFSFLINVDFDWVDKLIERMKRLGFSIKCKIEMEKTVTLVLQNSKLLLAKQK